MIGFWATLSLNIPDFSRYAVSQRDQILGQALGLPLTMALFAFIGVAVTSATTLLFGQTIWDPVLVMKHFQNPIAFVVAMLAVCVATLATNIAANVVSPANDFSHLAPRRISFRVGGLITGLVGIAMMPWKLLADPGGYIYTWLVGYSGLLGPIGGILIADYYVCRRLQLDVAGLYQENGPYSFRKGISWVAMTALALGILPSLPGFLSAIGAVTAASIPGVFHLIYDAAWLVGFAVAFIVYVALRPALPKS
jgi:NCS1 family nucleobase:cation symporter-1